MPGYETTVQRVTIAGANDLLIRSLLDKQQFFDPEGEAERLGISSACWPLFGLLWPSGIYLAERIAQRAVHADERILEIGCGLALASLVGHRRGMDVTASDCHPLTETFLRENLRLNGLAPMKYRHGQWGATSATPALPAPLVQGQYDLIVASDVLYERDASGELPRFIADHSTPAAEIWVIDPDRSNRPAFTRQMATHGFKMREERLNLPASAGRDAYKGHMLTYWRE